MGQQFMLIGFITLAYTAKLLLATAWPPCVRVSASIMSRTRSVEPPSSQEECQPPEEDGKQWLVCCCGAWLHMQSM